MPRHRKELLLALLVGGVFGGALAWSLKELSWLKYAKSPFLAALVYGPLLSFGELSRPVAWKAGCDAVAFAIVWQARRDRRWLPLATVIAATIVFGVLAGLDDPRLIRSFLRSMDTGSSHHFAEIKVFSRHSLEGFIFLTLGAAAWYALLIGCVVDGWIRRDKLAPDATESFGDSRSGMKHARDSAFSGVLRAAAPIFGGLVFGYVCGAILDSASDWILSPYRSTKGSDTMLRLIVAGQSAVPKVGMGSPRFLLAGLFACQTLLLWHAADGTRWRRAAAACYVFLLAAQVVGLISAMLPDGAERFFAVEWPSLQRIFWEMPERIFFLGLALAVWHAMAIWCLFRYRPARSNVASTSTL